MTTLRVLSARAVKEAVGLIAAAFCERSGHQVAFSFAPVGTVLARLESGETADIVILSEVAISGLVRSGKIITGSQTPLAVASIGVAIRADAAVPDITTAEGFRATLIAARSVALSDPAVGGTAGTYLTKLFEEMGLANDIAAKAVRTRGGNEVAERVASGEADIGLTFISEIMAIPGAQVAGALPHPFGNDTTYEAAVLSGSEASDMAMMLINAFRDPDHRGRWIAAGLTPIASQAPS